MNDYIDTNDRKKLLTAVLRHAMDDIVRLMHPKYRRKKYLEEAYQQAIDMFFDSEYRMLKVKDETGEDMSLKELLTTCISNDLASPEALKSHLISETLKFWTEKDVTTVYIPDSFVVEGHPYRVFHREDIDYHIDYDDKIVYLNRDEADTENQERFVIAMVETLLYHTELPVSKKDLPALAKAFYRLMKFNDCFVGTDVRTSP